MGRNSPAALLDMLAEVASQTLHSEKKLDEFYVMNKMKSKTESTKRKSHETTFSVEQLLAMPASQLVKQFSVFTSDELKRQYSYACALIPGCTERYTSFASECRARMSIKAHLADHLEFLKRDAVSYSSFTAIAVKYKSPKSSLQNKRSRAQQPKKMQEIPNKENKEVKSEKSTNYLRKILSNEMNFEEFERHRSQEKVNNINENYAVDGDKESNEMEFKGLGDHSYYDHARYGTPLDKKVSSDISDTTVNEALEENIMLMVVESNGVHMKELPYAAPKMKGYSNLEETKASFLPAESASWSEEDYNRSAEIVVPAKPKGKAKFIGTSKEEREMALALIERIKRKGNPTGGNLQCRICDPPRSFTAPTTLVSHYRSHAGIKPYECRICHAVFTRRHSLKYHMLIHQNQTRFTCADCGKKFRHPSHFREHRRRHTGEAPFGCEDCGQRFKTRNTYKRHLKTRHGKVLTTTGELLCLSEEDFQKVRTSRKRKADSVVKTESMAEEDITAPEAIIQHENDDSNDTAEQQFTDGYYVEVNGDGTDEGNNVWSTDQGRIVTSQIKNHKECETNEESHESKTEYIETEITVDETDINSNENEMNRLRFVDTVDSEIYFECDDEDRGDEIEMDTTLPDNVEIVDQDEENQVLYHNDLENNDCENVLYEEEFNHQVQYTCKDSIGIHEKMVEYRDDALLGDVHQVVKTEDDNSANYNDSSQKVHEYCISKQDSLYVLSGMDVPDGKEVSEESILSVSEVEKRLQETDCSSENEEQDKYTDDIFLLGNKRVRIVRRNGDSMTEFENSLQTIENDCNEKDNESVLEKETLKKDEVLRRHHRLPLFQLTEKSATGATGSSVQEDDIRDLNVQRKLKLSRADNSGKLQLTKSESITVFDEETRSMNVLQRGRQKTILLLANKDDLKNGFLKIERNGVLAIDATKTLSIVALPQK
ncbi:uncharacterized protein LOC107267003 isoform X2 [Cephus cinctus]|nr:uncharacterized protein LOC107267003 isoform X2 [Cephus cinctus]XP_024939949.1 uncharacterized protein LOC107267003 isoform X2 [Cephus cinctus]